MNDSTCFAEGCTNTPEFTASWRIRGPKEGATTNDRILPGNTSSTTKACSEHQALLAQALRGLFK